MAWEDSYNYPCLDDIYKLLQKYLWLDIAIDQIATHFWSYVQLTSITLVV